MQKRSFTQQELKKIKYCYFKVPRCFSGDLTQPIHFTNITVAYLGNKYAMAVQSLNDQFNKSIGRAVSSGRLSLEKTQKEFPFKAEEVSKAKIGEFLFEVFKNNRFLLPDYWDNINDDDLFIPESFEAELKTAFMDFPVK